MSVCCCALSRIHNRRASVTLELRYIFFFNLGRISFSQEARVIVANKSRLGTCAQRAKMRLIQVMFEDIHPRGGGEWWQWFRFRRVLRADF